MVILTILLYLISLPCIIYRAVINNMYHQFNKHRLAHEGTDYFIRYQKLRRIELVFAIPSFVFLLLTFIYLPIWLSFILIIVELVLLVEVSKRWIKRIPNNERRKILTI